MRKFTLFMLCVLAWATASAVPAKKGTRVFIQADGTQIHLQLAGDEWHHSLVTAEGMAVDRADDGNFYYRTAQGLSSVMAHDASDRSAAEAQFIAANGSQMTLQSLFTTDQSARRSRAQVARKASQVPQTGSPRIPVILVNYTDKKFISDDPVATWTKQICAPGEVSVYQYFVDQSFGKYTPQFDIYGPYDLANTRVTYGGNDRYGNDKGVGKMVAEACMGMDSTINWTDYDNDGDGVCDVVIVLYAGDGEASSYASDYANAVWPCQWELASSDYGSNLNLDGVTVSKFAVFNELYGADRSKIDGIGTMCHEFSHCLDLPDFYPTDYSNHFGMGDWSLLDGGCYNDNGYTPCGYTAYERNFMGWFDLTDPVEDTTYTTLPVQQGGQAYKVTSSNPNEYYILENIQQTGWNKYAPATGLQITHVNYSPTKWLENTVNNSDDKGMTIIPADNNLPMTYSYGYYYVVASDEPGDLWPYNGVDALTSKSTPAATLYTVSQNLDKPITAITRNDDGTVSFTYMAPPPAVPVALDATDVDGTSAVAHWEPTEGALSYTLQVNPKPTYSQLLSETFAKCITANPYSDVSKTLDTYMDNAGWTGSTLYVEQGGLRMGTAYYAGSLISPAVDLSESDGKVTIAVTGRSYNTDTDCPLTITVGQSSETVTFASTTPETHYVTLDCNAEAGQNITLAGSRTYKRLVLTGIDIYSGDATADLTVARAPAETRTGDQILVTGITDTCYTITGLLPATDYIYKVKAVYDEDESEWSNIINFTTVSVNGDINGDGIVDITDVNMVINMVLGKVEKTATADLDGSGDVDITDVNAVINIMLGK